ncbi:MAG TPA: hypothetical protein VLK25_01260 [Allosphingosinicella sp.]|nr:hypothetical protein [Allosphingosinicella sp.]
MRRAAVLVALLFAGAAAARERPAVYYACKIERANAGGSLSIEWRVPEDGAGGPSYIFWSSQRQLERVNFSTVWPIADGRIVSPDGVMIYVTQWHTRGRRRIELRRVPEAADQPVRMYAGRFDRRRFQVSISIPLPGMRAFLRRATALEVRVVDPRGRILASEMLNPALVETLPALLDGLQAELDAVRANYRERCERREPGDEIVVV